MIEALKFWFVKGLGEFLGGCFMCLVAIGFIVLFYGASALVQWGRGFRKRGK